MTEHKVHMGLSGVRPIEQRNGDRTPGAIYEYLRELIIEGVVPPQTVISQVALSRQLGVSRTPLREALRRLQQEGLIEAQHNQRARVVGFDPDDLEWVYCNRLLYEPLGIALTVPKLSPADLAAIDDLLEEMSIHAKAGDEAAQEDAHRRFHRSLGMHADDQLKRAIATFADRGDRYRRLYRSTVEHAGDYGASEHQAIVAACHARDVDEAVVQLARHLSRTALTLLARTTPERDPVSIRTALRLIAQHALTGA